MRSRKIEKKVATVITQVEVSKDDRAFENPTKPIGSFYDKETAEKLAKEKSFTMVEDAGRGYRRVVPSPKPADRYSCSRVIESVGLSISQIVKRIGYGISAISDSSLQLYVGFYEKVITQPQSPFPDQR